MGGFGLPTRRAFVTGLAASCLPKSVLGQQQVALPRYPRGAQVPARLSFLSAHRITPPQR